MPSSALSAVDTETLNADKFFNTLDRNMGACIGVLAIRTREIDRAKNLLHEWASIREMDFSVWTPVTGFCDYKAIPTADAGAGERPTISSSDDVSDYLTPKNRLDAATIPADKAWNKFSDRYHAKEHDKNRFCGVFIGLNQQTLDHPSIQQHIRDHVQRAYQSDDRAIMILSPGVSIPTEIQNDVELIDLHTPSYAELSEVLTDLHDQIKERCQLTLSENGHATIVQNGMGMTQQEFENALSLAIVDMTQKLKDDEGYEVTPDDFVKVMRERKLEILKNTQILELMPTAKMSDVGGLDLLKAFLKKRALAFKPEARKFGIKPPKGFIAVGPPGGGKSLVTQAVCDEFGQAGIRFDIGKVFGSFVGQSEERTRMALSMLEDMAPCVVQIEEIEKALGGGGGSNDGGTGSRVFGTILTWMQDKTDRGIPITIVASANDVTKIPPEMLRKGRFDAVFGIDLPTQEEREQIFRIHIKKRGHSLSEASIKKLAKESENFVGAEIEAAVEEALFDDFEAGNDGLTYESLTRALENTVTQSSMFPDRIKTMQDFVQQHGRPASSGSTFDSRGEALDIPKATRVRKPKMRLRSTRN